MATNGKPTVLHYTTSLDTSNLSTSSDAQDPPFPPRSHQWRPSFWRARPMIGIASGVVAILALLVSLAILLGSDGQPTSTWYFQPTVYLAIATAVSNAALRSSFAQAAPISWWHSALKGSTVQNMELNYEAGESFPRALVKSFRYRRTNLLTLASFAVTFVLIDGPLLQRASGVTRAKLVRDVSLNISVVPELPSGFSGYQDEAQFENMLSPGALDVSFDWAAKKPMKINAYCDGTCSSTIRAPGVALLECREHIWPINRTALTVSNMTWGTGVSPLVDLMLPIKSLVFSTYGAPMECTKHSNREPIQIFAGIANYQDCEGEFRLQSCTYTPAILEYDVNIEGHTIELATSANQARIVALANNTCQREPDSTRIPWAAGMMLGFLQLYMTSVARLGVYDTRQHKIMKKGPVESWYSPSFNAFSTKYILRQTWSSGDCYFSARSPMDDMVAAVNDLAFRAGLLTASWSNVTQLIDPGLETYQVVQTKAEKEENVFSSDLRWFAGAAAIQFFTILLLAPSFWGWWKIGVELSLSPLQIAKAFGSPILDSIHSGAGARGIVQSAGHWKLKLGIVGGDDPANDGHEHKRKVYTRGPSLGFDHPDRVEEPQKGSWTPY